jgi:tryptophan-rich sensory protein
MDTKKRKLKFKPLPYITSLLITLGIGVTGSSFTPPQIDNWYLYLHKPKLDPSGWVFGPAWIILYILIGTSAYIAWQQRDKSEEKIQDNRDTKRIYFLQLFLNLSWVFTFFYLHLLFTAFIVIVLLFISIIFNMISFNRISKAARWLLAPYLLWVAFAGVLNFYFYLLNRLNL